ncbi:MAG: tetratricopeptide repeat protein [Bacteroidetes bacterium]|nr:tetratricopeptide repeat protein [Bacteroidota bacterium]
MATHTEKEKNNVKWFTLGAILAFTVILFSGSLNHDILYGWDDGEYINDKSIRNMEVKNFFSDFYLGMYQPLAVLSLSLNYQTAKDNPVPYHTTNLLLHLINVILVFFLFHRIAGRLDIASFVALLFAIHPMHVEAVAWIATRSNSLYSAFYLAALLTYVIYLEKRSIKFLLLTMLFFILSCFSKSMAVTLPVLLLLFDYFYEREFKLKVYLEKVPFFVISIIFGVITINAASEFDHIKNLSVDYNILDRAVMLMYSVVFYLVKAIAPANLSAVYAYPDKAGMFLPGVYYFGVFIFAVIVLNVIILGRSRKTVMFGMLFFLITISLVLPLVWSRMLMLADRYTYIPYLGIFFMFARLYIKYVESESERIHKYKIFINTAIFVYIIFLAGTTYQRVKVWKDAETMITDVIEKDRSDVDVSIGYFFRGNIRDKANDMQGALQDFSRAIELNPEYTMAYNNRGIIKGSMQDFKGALDDFNKAVELEPEYAEAIYNRGNAHYYLKQFVEACSDWSLAAYLGFEQAAKVKKEYCR